MSVDLVFAQKNKRAFRNLLNAYLAELSLYNELISCDKRGVFEPGLCRELLSKSYNAYLIYADDRPVGFVVIGPGGSMGSQLDIEEFYIIPAVRRGGVGKQAVGIVFSRYKGLFHLHVHKSNDTALAFWRNTLERLGIEYEFGSDYPRAYYMLFTI